jgi:HEAT repeat protein
MTFFPGGAAADRILELLLISTIVLLAATTAFAVLALILRLRHTRSEARARELEGRWRPLILAAVSDPTQSHRLEGAVAPGEELYFIDQIWSFARRVRGVERETLARAARPYLRVLVERSVHPDEDVRARAIQTLAGLGMPEHVGTILAALDDRSAHVSMTAARALARPEHPQHASAVLARLDRFHLWSHRYLAAMLAAVGPEAARYLRRILGDDGKSEWSRTVCASALTLRRDLEGGDLAATILQKGGPSELMSACAVLLVATARPDHVQLLRRLSSSADYVVRMIALEGLAALGDAADLSRLEVALHDSSPWVALRAAYALRELQGGRAVLGRLAESGEERAVVAHEVLDAIRK